MDKRMQYKEYKKNITRKIKNTFIKGPVIITSKIRILSRIS
jgi:hypothetical protein